MNVQETDENLMQLYQEGHRSAFEILFARHRQKVWNFLLRRLSNHENAEEAFQLTWIKFHENRFRYDAQYPLLPWIFLIARQSLIDWIRKQKRHRAEPLSNELLDSLAVSTSEEAVDITNLWSQMSEEERILYREHFEEDQTFDEIARKMNLSSATLRKRFSRMIQRLKKGDFTS